MAFIGTSGILLVQQFSSKMLLNSSGVMSNLHIPQKPLSGAPIRRKTNTLQNAAVLKVLLNSIALRPLTQPQIIEITGLANSTVSRWLRFFDSSTKESKNLVYIADWKRRAERGNWQACWMLGYGMANVPKPKPMTSSEYHRRWKKKKSQESQITVTSTGVKHVVK
jgi:hypothetical protein